MKKMLQRLKYSDYRDEYINIIIIYFIKLLLFEAFKYEKIPVFNSKNLGIRSENGHIKAIRSLTYQPVIILVIYIKYN